MAIEIGTPASLLLGVVPIPTSSDGEPSYCWLGITVQHPPTHLVVKPHRKLVITGARADLAHQQARQFLTYRQLQIGGEIEIEWATPKFMGLGSAPMLGLSVARGLSQLAQLNDDTTLEESGVWALATALDLPDRDALAVWGFAQGGLLLVETQRQADAPFPQLLRRYELQHMTKTDWVFVLYFPRVSAGPSDDLEAERVTNLLQAAPYLGADTTHVVLERMLPAVEQDDIETFAQGLMELQAQNRTALAQIGAQPMLSEADEVLLQQMQSNGALAWGQLPGGRALFALVRSAQTSIMLRRTLYEQVGPYGGRLMATITDNRGCQLVRRS